MMLQSNNLQRLEIAIRKQYETVALVGKLLEDEIAQVLVVRSYFSFAFYLDPMQPIAAKEKGKTAKAFLMEVWRPPFRLSKQPHSIAKTRWASATSS